MASSIPGAISSEPPQRRCRGASSPPAGLAALLAAHLPHAQAQGWIGDIPREQR